MPIRRSPRPLAGAAPAASLTALVAAAALALGASALAGEDLRDPREEHLREVRQLTFGGENAEAYWSPAGDRLIFQSTRPPYGCDQIFLLDPLAGGEPERVSTGTGRTTCGYFAAGGDRVVYSSTHAAGPECPPPPDRSQGYVWPLYDTYEIYSAALDGGDLRALTDNEAYDAEATVCPVDGSIVFTSTRDGDLDLYRMDADGSNVRRLTEAPGYDGGAFFSADCSMIVWRASRPRPGSELDDFKALLERGLVRPGQLELWVAEADGSEARQVTYLGAASFAPYFFPAGDRIIFSSNHGEGGGREFDLWAVDVDGTDLERITWTPGFDGFPMFSPDGSRLVFASNRRQSRPGETNVFVADWVAGPKRQEESAADRFLADVAWLADDAREGRGIETGGIGLAAGWLADRFREIGLEPAGDFLQPFDAPVAVTSGPGTALAIDGAAVSADDFTPLGFSASASAAGEVVFAGYGISSEEHSIDDYAGLEVDGRLVAVRRFTPEGEPFSDDAVERKLGDLRRKAFTAREKGALALLVVDLPEVEEGAEPPEEAPLPKLTVDTKGDAGIPVVAVGREPGRRLLSAGARASLTVELETHLREAHNVVGRLDPEGAPAAAGAVLIGAHYDHLGFGGSGSLAPDETAPHNGADDNASGTAALLEAARELAGRRSELARPVWFVAFSGEESGLLGSTAFVRSPPPGLEIAALAAMINLDMVGRLRGNRLSVLGGDSAEEWPELVEPACERAGVECVLGGDGYGPSDQTAFYAAGVPVLHLFTGAHEDYHKPSDDWEKINAGGGAQIARLTADLGGEVAAREAALTYKQAEAPAPQGDVRSYGASLGTIPDYVGPPDGRPGVLLAGVRPESGAEKGGLQRGDLLVGLGGHEIRDIHDFMFVLQQAKPGERVVAVVERSGERLELEVEFGVRRSIR